jgi:4-amino-4-deoxy-L-arabinose transferase-like glycosyltransferase
MRFAGGDTAHSVLPLIQRGDMGGVLAGFAVYLLFYVVVLWLGGLSMVGGANVLWAREDDPLRLYLRRWAWLVFGLFTLSFTKLPAYIFPMFPALALLVGARVARGRVVYTPTPTLPACGEGGASPPPFTGEVGRGAKSRAPVRRLLTVASLARSAGTLVTVLGAAVWAGVALYRPLWEGAPWAVALALGMPLTMLALYRPVAPPWMRAVGALALLIGWNGALTGYDRLALRPVRELALKPPPYRTLILYRVNPGYPQPAVLSAGRVPARRRPRNRAGADDPDGRVLPDNRLHFRRRRSNSDWASGGNGTRVLSFRAKVYAEPTEAALSPL